MPKILFRKYSERKKNADRCLWYKFLRSWTNGLLANIYKMGKNIRYSYTDFSRLFMIFLQLTVTAAAGSLTWNRVEHKISKDGGKRQFGGDFSPPSLSLTLNAMGLWVF